MKIFHRIILFCILLTATGFSKEDIAGVVSVETFDEIYVEDILDYSHVEFYNQKKNRYKKEDLIENMVMVEKQDIFLQNLL